MERLIDTVLTHGTPSHCYIIKRDVLGLDIKCAEMLALQEQILQLKGVKKLLKTQNTDGWFGLGLHGGASMDGIVIALRQAGVEAYQPFMKKAKQAVLAEKNPFLQKAEKKAGWPPVETYCHPRVLVLAALYDNDENDTLLTKFQEELLQKFEQSLHIESLDEISRELTTKRFTQTSGWKWHPHTAARVYFKDKIDSFPWPSDLEMLASCLNWKNQRTAEITTQTMYHVSGFAPVPLLFSPPQIGPVGSYEMLDYPFDDPHLRRFTTWRLQNYLNLCKVCNVKEIPHYFQNVLWLKEHLEKGTLAKHLTTPDANEIDIYFMVLLILHYANEGGKICTL
jgi:hypothetical protein